MPTLYTYDDLEIGYDEKCFFYNGDFDPNCTVPNSYDDPSLGYDEKCFFYNGPGYDEVCLATPIPVVVNQKPLFGGYTTPLHKRQHQIILPWLDVCIEASLEEVNDSLFVMEPKILTFKGENPDMTITINGFQFDSRFPSIKANIVLKQEQKEEISLTANFIETKESNKNLVVEMSKVTNKELTVTVEGVDSKNSEDNLEVMAALIKVGSKNE